MQPTRIKQMQLSWRMIVAILAGVLASTGCSPAAKSIRCTNDATCREQDPELQYCASAYCVQCVSNVSCDKGKICNGGVCTNRQ